MTKQNPSQPSKAPSAPLDIEPLADNPDYAAASQIERVLADAGRRIERERDLLALERHFSLTPQGQHGSPRNAILKDRLTLRRKQSAEDARTKPADASAEGMPEAVARALKMITNGTADRPQNRAARLAELAEQADIIEDARRAQGSILAEMRRDLSRDLCIRLIDQHDAQSKEMFEAAQRLCHMVERERAFRAEILQAGYEIAGDLISPPGVSALLMLGSEQQHDSAISTWRRDLENKGILK